MKIKKGDKVSYWILVNQCLKVGRPRLCIWMRISQVHLKQPIVKDAHEAKVTLPHVVDKQLAAQLINVSLH